MMLVQPDISEVELKQRWRIYWIETIYEFANKNLQHLSWVEGSIEWDSSFDQCRDAYFDTLFLYKGYEKPLKDRNVTQEEVQQVALFHQLLTWYEPPTHNPQDILQDGEWQEVVDAAKDFFCYLRGSVRAQREQERIMELEKLYGRL